jgi:hypothetical protein
MINPPPRDEAPSADAPYGPEGSVRALLATDLVREPTRASLQARLARPAVERPTRLAEGAFLTLRAVCARLVPQPERGDAAIDLAGAIDGKLGMGNGWRYSSMPPDADAFRRGLAGVGGTALAMFGSAFRALDAARQDEVLERLDRAGVPAEHRTFRTKPEIAVAELDRVMVAGVRFSCVLADAGYGISAAFPQGLSTRGLAWAVGIPRIQKVFPADIAMVPPPPPVGRPASPWSPRPKR